MTEKEAATKEHWLQHRADRILAAVAETALRLNYLELCESKDPPFWFFFLVVCLYVSSSVTDEIQQHRKQHIGNPAIPLQHSCLLVTPRGIQLSFRRGVMKTVPCPLLSRIRWCH